MIEDSEITLARRLNEVLSDIRRDLDEQGTKRVILFIFDRYGISIPALSILPLPPQKAPLKRVQDIHDEAVGLGEARFPQLTLECPICHKNGFKGRAGTAGHMIRVHHKTPKVYFEEIKSQT